MKKWQWVPSFWSLGLALLLTGVATLSAVPARAIPVAGDYIFTSGRLEGTFTSDGNALTEWSFTVRFSHITWSPTLGNNNIIRNDDVRFLQDTTGPEIARIDINWPTPTGLPLLYSFETPGPGADFGEATFIQVPSTNVPEPSTAVLAGSGLLLLLGYGWWQRRHRGLQVG